MVIRYYAIPYVYYYKCIALINKSLNNNPEYILIMRDAEFLSPHFANKTQFYQYLLTVEQLIGRKDFVHLGGYACANKLLGSNI